MSAITGKEIKMLSEKRLVPDMKEKIKVAELGEICTRIGKKLIASPLEDLKYEELVVGKKSDKTIVNHFKVEVIIDNESYNIYAKFKDFGKKDLDLAELTVLISKP
jgi:hypothetical protein